MVTAIPKRTYTCACGCGRKKETWQPHAKYFSKACKNRDAQRRWRRRNKPEND